MAAAAELVAHAGVAAAGVNAVARAARVDKVLIYRYFGGHAGLLEAVAEAAAARTAGGGDPAPAERERTSSESTLAEAIEGALERWSDAVREDPMTRAAEVAGLAGANPLADRLATRRDEESERMHEELRRRFSQPPFIDVPALVALLSAGLAHLELQSAGRGHYRGLDVRSPEGRRRVEKTTSAILRALLESGDA